MDLRSHNYHAVPVTDHMQDLLRQLSWALERRPMRIDLILKNEAAHIFRGMLKNCIDEHLRGPDLARFVGSDFYHHIDFSIDIDPPRAMLTVEPRNIFTSVLILKGEVAPMTLARPDYYADRSGYVWKWKPKSACGGRVELTYEPIEISRRDDQC